MLVEKKATLKAILAKSVWPKLSEVILRSAKTWEKSLVAGRKDSEKQSSGAERGIHAKTDAKPKTLASRDDSFVITD